MAQTDRHLVVDGSNIATEGRSLPSLAQLDEAVRAISSEFPYESLTVVVDATFAHRIDDSEKDELEAAILAGEIVTPPAGAIGRGDAFILQVAEKVDGIVLSNDSFQEFHGQHDWLFDKGRLIGGKPIEGVGWVFVERSPVRGPTSRRSVREAGPGGSRGRGKRGSSSKGRRSTASGPAPKPSKSAPPPAKRQATAKRQPKASKPTKDTSTSSDDSGTKGGDGGNRSGSSTRKKGSTPKRDRPAKDKADSDKKTPEPLNDPRTFVGFVSQYSIGDEVRGEVERFSSHGCYVRAAEAQCYLPSRSMGDPPPSRARDVVSQGQRVVVKVESLDANRRGINVVLVEVVPGDDAESSKQERKQPTNNRDTSERDTRPAVIPQSRGLTADDEGANEGHRTRSTTNVATSNSKAGSRTRTGRRTTKRAPAKKTAATATSSDRVKRATAKKMSATNNAAKKTTAKKSTATKSTAKKSTATKSTAKKSTAKKSTAKKSTATKSTAKKSAATKSTAKKSTATKSTAKKSTAKKSTANKNAAKKTTAKKTSPAKKSTAKKTTANKSTAKKTTATKNTAKKPTAKKGTAKKA